VEPELSPCNVAHSYRCHVYLRCCRHHNVFCTVESAAVCSIQSLKGSWSRLSPRKPANMPPRNATGSCRSQHATSGHFLRRVASQQTQVFQELMSSGWQVPTRKAALFRSKVRNTFSGPVLPAVLDVASNRTFRERPAVHRETCSRASSNCQARKLGESLD